jgi:hypothetical protein
VWPPKSQNRWDQIDLVCPRRRLATNGGGSGLDAAVIAVDDLITADLGVCEAGSPSAHETNAIL